MDASRDPTHALRTQDDHPLAREVHRVVDERAEEAHFGGGDLVRDGLLHHGGDLGL